MNLKLILAELKRTMKNQRLKSSQPCTHCTAFPASQKLTHQSTTIILYNLCVIRLRVLRLHLVQQVSRLQNRLDFSLEVKSSICMRYIRFNPKNSCITNSCNLAFMGKISLGCSSGQALNWLFLKICVPVQGRYKTVPGDQ